jgi:hypothetical protein
MQGATLKELLKGVITNLLVQYGIGKMQGATVQELVKGVSKLLLTQ